MITVIVNKVAGRQFEHETLRVDKPAEVVGCILGHPVSPLCLGLDLDRMGLTVDEMVGWIREFRKIYRPVAAHERRAGLPPSVAVFADSLGPRDSRALREVGALVFDRSSPATDGSKTSDDLLAQLAAIVSPSREAPTAASQEPLSEPDRGAANAFPAGMSPDRLDHIIAELNRQDH